MRGRVRRLRPDCRCKSTAAAVRTFRSSANAADAIADPQSIQSQYRAATELHTKYNTFDTKQHGPYNSKQRSKRRGYLAGE
jgi:hypothetical protein